MSHQPNYPISRRTFLSLGLAAPLATLAGSRQTDSPRLFPVSMDRCVVLTGGEDRLLLARRFARLYEIPEFPNRWTNLFSEPESLAWDCRPVFGISGQLVDDWWLLISPSEACQPDLTVIHTSSASAFGMLGMLAARVTFRLRVGRLRGAFQGSLGKRRIVQRVNRQIRGAMKNMPV